MSGLNQLPAKQSCGEICTPGSNPGLSAKFPSRKFQMIKQKKEKLIHTITTVRLENGNWNTRCVGYYLNRTKAINAVRENIHDIYEMGYYPYAVVESVGQGIYYLNREEIWFKWNEAREKYEMLDEKPEMFKRTCCYGIG